MPIQGSVGRNSDNSPKDVVIVQQLLNDNGALLMPMRIPPASGTCSQQTIDVLETFQKRVMGMQAPTGRVEPNSATWYALNGVSGPAQSQYPLLEEALRATEAEAAAFAKRFIQDAKVRANYVAEAQKFSREIMEDVQAAKLTPEAAAAKASEMRNTLLDASRLNNSDIGRAISEAEKATGKTMAQLMEYYAQKLHGREFGKLTAAEQDAVFLEIVRASGRPNPRFTAAAAKFGKVGKGLIVVTIAIAAYTIATSDRPGRETVKQGTSVAAGLLGSMAMGAAAGFVCGPGSPVCVGVGAFIGGLAFAVGADLTFDWLWK